MKIPFFIKIIYTQIIVKEHYTQTKLFSDNQINWV